MQETGSDFREDISLARTENNSMHWRIQIPHQYMGID